jgi:hypothetical protein
MTDAKLSEEQLAHVRVCAQRYVHSDLRPLMERLLGEHASLRAEVARLTGGLRAEYDRGRREGRDDVGKYAGAIGSIECALGIYGAVPLSETVEVAKAMAADNVSLRAQLAEVRRLCELATEDVKDALIDLLAAPSAPAESASGEVVGYVDLTDKDAPAETAPARREGAD